MHNDRQLQLGGQIALRRKRVLLRLARDMPAMEIKPGLADGAYVRVGGQAAQLPQAGVVEFGAFVRMHSDGGEPPIETLAQLGGAATGGQIGGDDQDAGDRGLAGARVDLVDVIGKGRIGEMRVGVEQLGYAASTLGNSAGPPGTA